VGRLSTEKGVEVLLNAWRQLRGRVPLVIVGDGPLAPAVAAAASQIDAVRWLGRQPHSEVQRLIAAAACLVFPSLAYETFGQVIGEAYAAGTPVIASSRGAAAELVEHQRTGLLARPGDAQDVAAQVECMLSCPERLTAMRTAARRVYESQLTADANLRQLTAIYASVGARSEQLARPA
jgi:glycosyltransferase involved in cell wall biosynthesis